MSKHKGVLAIVGLAVLLAVGVACGGGLSEEDVETRAQELADQMVAEMDSGDAAPVVSGERLAAIQDRGKVICASRNDVPGYGSLDASGNNVGFDIDLCRAVAAAVLGDPNAIEIRLITAAERGPTNPVRRS